MLISAGLILLIRSACPIPRGPAHEYVSPNSNVPRSLVGRMAI